MTCRRSSSIRPGTSRNPKPSPTTSPRCEAEGTGRSRPKPIRRWSRTSCCPSSAPRPSSRERSSGSTRTASRSPIANEVEQGHVVLIDFWTYTCINCIRTLPYLKAWDEEYRDDGLTIVGVHAPEFPFEKEASNVEDAIADNGIEYPVVQDNDLATWTAWGNQYWPAKYLIDAEGQVRYTHFGEGSYDETEQAIRSLLAEAGDDDLGAEAKATGESIDPKLMSPETYLGSLRADGWVEPVRNGTTAFDAPAADSLDLNEFAYDGTWEVTDEGATSVDGAEISFRFQAKNVFLVLGAEDGPSPVEVLLDGEPVSDANAGSDVDDGVAEISSERLYRLVELDKAGQHTLTLRFAPGITGYAFTFG